MMSMDNVLKEMEITPMLLKAIFLQHAGLPFRLTQLETNMEMGICGGELRAAVPFLLREGKLEAVKNRSGELLLRMNKEGLIMLANQWVAEDLIPYDPFKFVSDMECGENLIYTLLRWLAWIYYNGLAITAKGTLSRKTITALQQLTPFEDVQLKGLQLVAQDDLPISIALMLDILVKMTVLQLEAGQWKIQDANLQDWLNLDLSSANKKLLDILCQNYVPARKYQQQVVALLTCTNAQQGEICLLDKVLSKLQHTAFITSAVEKEQALWLDSWLYVLGQCGWLERGKLMNDLNDFSATVFRWREDQFNQMYEITQELNNVEQLLIIQPDFEILVSPNVDIATRYELELMTECVYSDVMSQYRLTKRKYCLALQSGLSWGLPVDLPAHISLAISDWTKETHLNKAKQTIMIEDQQTNRPLHEGTLKKVSKGRLADDTQFVQSNPQLPPYLPYTDKLNLPQIFPDLERVPLKWRQQLSSYHHSTLRYLIEQAITWQIKIELKLKEQCVCMIPTNICEELDGWRVVGAMTSPIVGLGEPVLQSIPSHQCYGAKLLVPDISADNVSTFYSDSCNNML